MKITLNNCTINYAERGLPQGNPVVFVHGFPFDHTMWEPQMMALPNHFRAITYDVRGHGGSDVGDGQYTIEFFVDDLISLLDHLVIEKAVLCGLSMGGYIALRGYERHPERFKALVLCDTKSEADTNEGKIKRSATLKTVKTEGVGVFAEEFVKTIFDPETCQTHPEIVESIKQHHPVHFSDRDLRRSARPGNVNGHHRRPLQDSGPHIDLSSASTTSSLLPPIRKPCNGRLRDHNFRRSARPDI